MLHTLTRCTLTLYRGAKTGCSGETRLVLHGTKLVTSWKVSSFKDCYDTHAVMLCSWGLKHAHWSASATSKTSLLAWLRYVKFVTSTVGSIDALVPPTPNLTRYKRELAVKAEEAAVTGRNSPKSAK